MLVDIDLFKYIPILSLRYSEMVALESLPNKDKDSLLPVINLRRWAGANNLSNSLSRVEKAFGKRPWIIDIDHDHIQANMVLADDKRKPVHSTLESLKDPSKGYHNWCSLIEEYPNLIPCLQLEDVAELIPQVNRLKELGRGIAVRFNEDNIAQWTNILSTLAAQDIQGLYVILDYGRSGQRGQKDLLLYTASVSGFVAGMAQVLPNATYIVSSTTFPTTFSDIQGIGEKTLYERLFFSGVSAQCAGISLIYSDWASTKAERADGSYKGSPRIDYPLKDSWKISREPVAKQKTTEEESRLRRVAFKRAAKALVNDPSWEQDLDVWGAKEIEAASKAEHITDARHATAVRINIHLHRQIYYNAPTGVTINTDDDWVD